VGESTTAGVGGVVNHAFLWENGEMTDLGTLGGSFSTAFSSGATGINSSGQVVGVSSTASGEQHAFLWENGEMTDLGTLHSESGSVATGINSSGQIVGYSQIVRYSDTGFPQNETHAVLWSK
jgi:probable HAF family extracellular repeat protein